MNGVRPLGLIGIIVAASLALTALGVSAGTQRTPTVTVSVDRKFGADGWYDFEIAECGVGPTGSYQRMHRFAAEIKRGLGIPTKFRNYEAVMTTERAGVWKTQREPIAGYLYVFFEEGRPYADLHLVESWDGHPTRMAINGIYPLAVR